VLNFFSGAQEFFLLNALGLFSLFFAASGNPLLCGFVWGNYTLLNIPAFCSLFIMGRGRKALLYQGQKSINRKRRNGGYLFLSTAPRKKKEEPSVSPGVVDRLKQMDPKALAALLLK